MFPFSAMGLGQSPGPVQHESAVIRDLLAYAEKALEPRHLPLGSRFAMALSRNTLLIIAAAVIVVAGGIGAWFLLKSPSEQTATTAPVSASTASCPNRRIVILNLAAVMGASQVGQSVGQQIRPWPSRPRASCRAKPSSAKRSRGHLQAARERTAPRAPPPSSRVRTLPWTRPAARGPGAAFAKAQNEISKVLEPILRQVTTAHSANLVLDRRATAGLADTSLDVTAEVVAQLNAKMPSYTVTLPTPQEMQALAKQMPPPQEQN